jgi:hypothetical protein
MFTSNCTLLDGVIQKIFVEFDGHADNSIISFPNLVDFSAENHSSLSSSQVLDEQL